MTQKEELVEVIEGDKYIIGLRKDDIVHVFYKDFTVIDIELQKELIFVFNTICKGVNKKFIFESGKSCNITREARNNAIKLEDQAPFSASVVVAQNQIIRIIADFFYFIKRPKTPYNIFTKFEDGIKWLLDVKV